jgi:pyruvate-formate lyase
MQMQFNVVDAKVLKDAQRNPEKYEGLLVRVAAYSAFFVNLEKDVQDDIINRTEHSW